jgi:hypothetical protein
VIPEAAGLRKPTIDEMEASLKRAQSTIAAMSMEAQYDVATFCRSFRNQLAAGPAARIALLIVAAEQTLEATKALAARAPAPRGIHE